jgi:YaiO family outer membrane protein
MRGRLRRFALLALLGACVPVFACADERVGRNHELVLMFLNGSYGAYPRSDDRSASAQYYFAPSDALKLFGEIGLSSRFGHTDYPFGGGAYWKAGQKDYVYTYLLFAVNPAVVANADLTAEYTRVLVKAITGSLGYRVMMFPRETVHMVVPSMDLYTIPRWTLTGRAYVSKLASGSSVRTAFLVRAVYDWTDGFALLVTATRGSEAYRAGSLQDFSTADSWSAGLGFKYKLSAAVRLRGGYEYLHRMGAFTEHQITLSTSFLW